MFLLHWGNANNKWLISIVWKMTVFYIIVKVIDVNGTATGMLLYFSTPVHMQYLIFSHTVIEYKRPSLVPNRLYYEVPNSLRGRGKDWWSRAHFDPQLTGKAAGYHLVHQIRITPSAGSTST